MTKSKRDAAEGKVVLKSGGKVVTPLPDDAVLRVWNGMKMYLSPSDPKYAESKAN